MSYPTATEILLHKNRVLRRDAMHCQNVAADLIGHLLRHEIDDETLQLRAKTEAWAALQNGRRYAFEARLYGHKLPG